MKYVVEYLRDCKHIAPLGDVTTEYAENYDGERNCEEVLIDGKSTDILIYYEDYIDWLETHKIELK